MTKKLLFGVAIAALSAAMPNLVRAELVAYWPLDEIDGGTTPDIVNDLDMEAENLDADFDIVEGKIDNAISFTAEFNTILTRVHEPDDPLPINQHPEYTITMWANVEGTGQNDLRLLSEGSTTDNNPLFNIGTANNGNNGTLDIFLRNNQASTPTVNHPRTNAEPFNGEWNHVAWTFSEGEHRIYINGEFDSSHEFQAFSDIDPFQLDNTSIGGILRGSPSHWVTGLIDDVAMWDEVLPTISISLLASEAVTPLTALDVLLGDFNFDGELNNLDFNILASHFRNEGAAYEEGDMNGDGTVDLHDFSEFLAAFRAAGPAQARAVPEPSSCCLAMMFTVFLGLFRRRSSRP